MTNLVEEFDYKGFKVQIDVDEFPPNPRTDHDNLGKMVCWHRKYDLGDKHEWTEVQSFLDFMEQNKGRIICMPLYLYDHSGLTISTNKAGFEAVDSAGWDWSQVGWIYVLDEDALKDVSMPAPGHGTRGDWEDAVRNILVAEVEEYDQYLRGEVYAYSVGVMKPDFKGGVSFDAMDSCSGVFGLDDCRQAAKEFIDHNVSWLTRLQGEGIINVPLNLADLDLLVRIIATSSIQSIQEGQRQQAKNLKDLQDRLLGYEKKLRESIHVVNQANAEGGQVGDGVPGDQAGA